MTDELEQLRRILFEPEQQKLSVLEKRLDDPELHAEEVSRVLPEAVMRSSRADDRLANAMEPAVETALKNSVRNNPAVLTDAIFPIIGPAIRRALADAFSKLLQSSNQAIEHSLSWKGLKWRLEAKRTGRPFAEVVLLHTLVFRVEQIFLIHQSDGLLLQHVVASEVKSSDEEVISGMLSAINSFVRDAFHSGGGDELHTIRVGELDVWVEAGPKATLAAVIRGQAPSELRQAFGETLESIHRDEQKLLDQFDGDTDLFLSVRPKLEECLQQRFAEERGKGKGKGLSPQFVIVSGIALILLAWWAGWSLAASERWKSLVATLKAEPGLVVTEAIKQGGKYHVAGLKDPLARDPVMIAQSLGIEPEKLDYKWEPYLAMNPGIALRRAKARLAPPSGVHITLADGVLAVRGSATKGWWDDVQPLARSLPGVERVDHSELEWEHP